MPPTTPARTDRLRTLADTVYVASRCKVVYVQVFKAACSTMLWTLLELEGHDPSVLDASLRADIPTHELLVHDRSLYPIPVITEVSAELRHEALTSDAWLRVAVTRNPYARLYSAWESKLLLGDPGPWQAMGGPPPVFIDGDLDVGESFRAFVADFAARPEIWMTEPHFATQSSLLALEEIDYDELVPTSRLGELIDTLSVRAGVHVTPPRANQGLGIDWAGLLDERSASSIASLYAADFEALGYEPMAGGDPVEVRLGPVAQRLRIAAIERSERTLELGAASQTALAAVPADEGRRRGRWRS